MTSSAMDKIPEALRSKINQLPNTPGVYQMLDCNGEIIYIGKSKNLKDRVKSYFTTQHQWRKLQRLVFNIRDIHVIRTDTHLEAQLLECTLIKSIKPLYNSQYKGEQRYQYLRVGEQWGEAPLVIEPERRDGSVLGPFRSKGRLEDLVYRMTHLYPLAQGASTFTYHFLPVRMSQEEFRRNAAALKEIFLDVDRLKTFIEQIQHQMKQCAFSQEFEAAQGYRDLLEALQYPYLIMERERSRRGMQPLIWAEAVEQGYKLLYIEKDQIIFSKTFPSLTLKDIEVFITEGAKQQEQENDLGEKASLDYRQIIDNALKERAGHGVLSLQRGEPLTKLLQEMIEETGEHQLDTNLKKF